MGSTVVREGNRVYIPNVRKVDWSTGEMCEFASSCLAALSALGEDVDYHWATCVSGAGFRFTLDPGQWNFGNYKINNFSANRYEPIERLFKAAGYTCTMVVRERYDASYGTPRPAEPPAETAAQMSADRVAICGSIDRGVPVPAFGVVGPSDCCVITGYDDRGESLMGWSTYQDIPADHTTPPDATGYFRKPDWHPSLGGYVLIGEKHVRPSDRETYLATLNWALDLARTPQLPGQRTGVDGLAAWADEMEQDAWFPADDEGLLGWRYVGVTINLTMLDDHRSAMPFLRAAAETMPEYAPGLRRAAGSYEEAVRLRVSLIPLLPEDFSPTAMHSLGNPAVRCTYAAILRRVHAVETQAVEALAEALGR